MKTIDKTVNEFRKAFLERLHGYSYEEVVKSELPAYKTEDFMSSLPESDILQMFDPITLGRLMAALRVRNTIFNITSTIGSNFVNIQILEGRISDLPERATIIEYSSLFKYCGDWKLIREDKTECDETDQTEETLIALTNILR